MRFSLALTLLAFKLADGAIAVNSQESGGTGHRASTSGVALTWAFNNVAGTKLICSIEVTNQTGSTVSITAGPTYNSVALTGIGSAVTWASGASLHRIFYLDSPAIGSNTVSVTGTGAGLFFAIIGGCLSLTGAATGVGTVTTGTGASGTTATAGSITTASGNYVIASGGMGSNSGGLAGTGFTRTWLVNGTSLTSGDNGLGEYAASSGSSITPTFTWNNSDQWGIQAVEIIAGSSLSRLTLMGIPFFIWPDIQLRFPFWR